MTGNVKDINYARHDGFLNGGSGPYIGVDVKTNGSITFDPADANLSYRNGIGGVLDFVQNHSEISAAYSSLHLNDYYQIPGAPAFVYHGINIAAPKTITSETESTITVENGSSSEAGSITGAEIGINISYEVGNTSITNYGGLKSQTIFIWKISAPFPPAHALTKPHGNRPSI